MGGLVTWLLAQLFGDGLLRWVAEKVLLTTLFTVVLPVVLNNFLYDFVQAIFTWINGQVSPGAFTNPAFTGYAAWFIEQLKLPDCLSVIMGGIILRLILRHVPFMRL